MGMHHLKIISTRQGYIHKYENLKRKLYSCNANIYFNQKYLWKNLITNSAMIKIPNISPTSKFTQQKASTIRIKDEISYLCTKKQQLNQHLLQVHLNKNKISFCYTVNYIYSDVCTVHHIAMCRWPTRCTVLINKFYSTVFSCSACFERITHSSWGALPSILYHVVCYSRAGKSSCYEVVVSCSLSVCLGRRKWRSSTKKHNMLSLFSITGSTLLTSSLHV